MGKEKKKAKSFDLASLDISYDWLLAELLTPELIHQYMTTAGWTPREVIRDRRIYWTRPGFPQVIQSTNKTTDLWDFLIRVAKVTKASLFQILFEVMEDAVTFQIAGREVKGLLGPEVESPLPAEKEIEPAANPSGKAALAKQLAAQNYKRTAIAQMLGVSRQTVSKYLNGKPAQKRQCKLDDAFKTKAVGLHQAGWKVADIFRDLQKSGYQGTYQYLAAFLKAKTRPTSMTPVPSAQEREKTEMVKGILLLRNLVFHFCNRAIREVDPDFQDEAMGKMMALQAPGKRDQLTPKN